MKMEDIWAGMWVWVRATAIDSRTTSTGDEIAGEVMDTWPNVDLVRVQVNGKNLHEVSADACRPVGPQPEPEPPKPKHWVKTSYDAGYKDGKTERDIEWANALAAIGTDEDTDIMDPESVAGLIKKLDKGFWEQLGRFTQLLGFLEKLTNGQGYPYHDAEWTPEMKMILGWLAPDTELSSLENGTLVHFPTRIINPGPPPMPPVILPPSKYTPPSYPGPSTPTKQEGERIEHLLAMYVGGVPITAKEKEELQSYIYKYDINLPAYVANNPHKSSTLTSPPFPYISPPAPTLTLKQQEGERLHRLYQKFVDKQAYMTLAEEEELRSLLVKCGDPRPRPGPSPF